MNTYTILSFFASCLLALCGISIYTITLLIRANITKNKEHENFVAYLMEKHKGERKDLLDRLMSRDLKEVKQAQAMEQVTGGRVVSKYDNDKRIAEENRKVAEGNL